MVDKPRGPYRVIGEEGLPGEDFFDYEEARARHRELRQEGVAAVICEYRDARLVNACQECMGAGCDLCDHTGHWLTEDDCPI